jgi:hypothetical protein
MPNILFIGFALITGVLAWNSRRMEVSALSGEVIAEGDEDVTEEVEFGLVDVKDAAKNFC